MHAGPHVAEAPTRWVPANHTARPLFPRGSRRERMPENQRGGTSGGLTWTCRRLM
ncbi:hypothetical protein D187_006258 [Cystobacter fuscus DSM 2262]|uniref:Uncharacterized protein n=1 Tax=Cystobacter fuscus (strain ATCC 25194 / DSM 2262 / NBRC 100088 / M29) TaxID=1242864 RepID=S9R1S1_CYSF2|nr:hypothetical protein D187_006258 [Cystobacter fuscus DSM 2262]